jgi:hypothetical protein
VGIDDVLIRYEIRLNEVQMGMEQALLHHVAAAVVLVVSGALFPTLVRHSETATTLGCLSSGGDCEQPRGQPKGCWFSTLSTAPSSSHGPTQSVRIEPTLFPATFSTGW